MAYDPYQNETSASVGSLAKDYATAGFKPATYVGMYAFPGMWSPSKGIYVPGIGRRLSRGGIQSAFTRVSRIYKARGPLKGTASILGGLFKKGASFGYGKSGGGGFLGGKSMELGMLAQDFYDDIVKQSIARSVKYGVEPAAAKAVATSTADQLLKSVSNSKVAAKATNFKVGSKFSKLIGSGRGLNALRIGTKWAKFGLGATKIATGIGAVMFAADMIKMVGEPLGRLAVRSLDNTLADYQERFMPETGGQLELGYLSRGAATERQRAVQAISKSYINGRSAMGNEAQYMHQ